MGLAKFFKNGLSSAVNLGNEAYAAPEILQGNNRDKRSDVWAMGKIIAELCARVRLPTRSVSPMKIKDSLKDNCYCSIVCKMVATNAAERSSMYGVIGEIRQIVASQGANQGVNQGAGAGRPHAALGGHLGPRLTEADFGVKQKWRPPTPFPPEAKHQEPPVQHPVERIHRSTSPRPHLVAPVVPVTQNALANQLSLLSIPCPLPQDGTVVQRRFDSESGQMQIKQIITRNGKVVKYEDLKITK